MIKSPMDSLSDIETSLSGSPKKSKRDSVQSKAINCVTRGGFSASLLPVLLWGGVTGSGCGLASGMINRNKIAATICVSENIRKV